MSFLDVVNPAKISADVASFSGTTTITANNAAAFNHSGFAAGFSLTNAATTVNIAGPGPTFVDDLFELNGGTVSVASGSELVLRNVTAGAASPTGNLTIAAGGEVNVGPNYLLEVRGFTNQFTITNNGILRAGGYLFGGGNTAGAGNVVVEGANSLFGVRTGSASWTLESDLSFLADSTLRLSIDPTAGTAQHISVPDLEIYTPVNIPVVNLSLLINNDTLLATGTKFLLADYDTLTPGEHFIGLADGTIFQQGLNSYEIRYSDSAYDAQNPSVITLTVVPEPSTWVLAALGAAGGLVRLRQRRRRAATASQQAA